MKRIVFVLPLAVGHRWLDLQLGMNHIYLQYYDYAVVYEGYHTVTPR